MTETTPQCSGDILGPPPGLERRRCAVCMSGEAQERLDGLRCRQGTRYSPDPLTDVVERDAFWRAAATRPWPCSKRSCLGRRDSSGRPRLRPSAACGDHCWDRIGAAREVGRSRISGLRQSPPSLRRTGSSSLPLLVPVALRALIEDCCGQGHACAVTVMLAGSWGLASSPWGGNRRRHRLESSPAANSPGPASTPPDPGEDENAVESAAPKAPLLSPIRPEAGSEAWRRKVG